ncbi:MAG: rhombosortase [Acidobacteriota bacterium]
MLAGGGKDKGVGARLGFPLLFACMACLLFFVPDAASFFQYDRIRIGEGELWRLVASHWTHWSAEHLFWDLAVFLFLLSWCLRAGPRCTGIVLGAASLVIPLGIYWIQPDLTYYRGLSGLDAALFALLAIRVASALKADGDRAGLLLVMALVAGLLVKIVYEGITGETVFVANMAPNVVVVPLAHLLGCGIGFAAGLWFPDFCESKRMQACSV